MRCIVELPSKVRERMEKTDNTEQKCPNSCCKYYEDCKKTNFLYCIIQEELED